MNKNNKEKMKDNVSLCKNKIIAEIRNKKWSYKELLFQDFRCYRNNEYINLPWDVFYDAVVKHDVFLAQVCESVFCNYFDEE